MSYHEKDWDPEYVDVWQETLLEDESLRVEVEITDREWSGSDWKVTISEDWDGAYPTETDLVESAIEALVEARRKLRRQSRRERWRLVAYRLVGRFSR